MSKDRIRRLTVTSKTTEKLVCAIRYDGDRHLFDIDESKSDGVDVRAIMRSLDETPKVLDKKTKDAAFVGELRVITTKRDWMDFYRRLSRFYLVEDVESFKKLK